MSGKVILRPAVTPDQDWSLLRVVAAGPPAWRPLFEETKDELADLDETLDHWEKANGPYFPLKKDLFRAFQLTPLSRVRVVLMGQDPYPQLNTRTGRPRAQGLSFGVDKSDEIPASLDSIFRDIACSYSTFIRPQHGDLTNWALQGVLLVNASLTVKPGVPGSHGEIWHGFIAGMIELLARERPRCIYLLMGGHAQHPHIMKRIGGKATVIVAPHPSPKNIAHGGFVGGEYFLQVNKALRAIGEPPIDWQL